MNPPGRSCVVGHRSIACPSPCGQCMRGEFRRVPTPSRRGQPIAPNFRRWRPRGVTGSFPQHCEQRQQQHPSPLAAFPPMSPLAGATGPEVEGRPYGTQIRWLAETYPDMLAVSVVAEDGSITRLDWRTLDQRSNQVARAFAAEGVGLGDRVGLELPNSVEIVEAVLACWKIGASPVPVRWDLPDWERA